jgi:hypothetical protein
MMGPQIFLQEIGGVAFTSSVTDEDDLICGGNIFCDFLIKRIFLGYALATLVRFLSMNQMMVKMEWIVRSHLALVFWATYTKILVDMGSMVVDDNPIIRLGRTGSSACEPCTCKPCTCKPGPASFKSLRSRETSSKPRSWVVGRLKKALVADAKRKFIVSMRLDLTQMFDEFYSLVPTEVMGQLAVEKILVQRFQVLAHLTFPPHEFLD